MEERKMILKMIEEGKITAEEGVLLLETIEKKQKDEERKTHQGSKEKKGERPEYLNSEQFQKVKEDLHEATEKLVSSANKGAAKLFDMLGKAMQKVQDMDFDFDISFNGGIKVTDRVEIPTFEFQKLSFSTPNGNIRCQEWDQPYAKIFITGYVSKVKDEEEALEKLRSVYEQKEEGEVFSFSLLEQKGVRGTIEVYVPVREYTKVELNTTHGGVQTGKLQAEQLTVHSTNGSIRLEKTTADSLEATTSNGRVQLHHIEAERGVIRSSNGSIHAFGHYQSLECETTNGSIRIQQEKVDSSAIKAMTHNGSIRVIYPDHIQGVHGEIKTGYGSMKCSLKEARITEEQGLSHNKKIVFQQGEEKQHDLVVESRTGSIHVLEKEEGDGI